CPNVSTFGTDPAWWAHFDTGPLALAATRFAFVNTSESETADAMRSRCLAIAGFPQSEVDALAPSQWAFFGPLSQGLDGRLPGLAAVRERASTLRDCALPGGTLARLPLRLHLRKSGAMRAVDFTGEPPPPQVASCVRKVAMKWEFAPIRLPTDTELLVAISFRP